MHPEVSQHEADRSNSIRLDVLCRRLQWEEARMLHDFVIAKQATTALRIADSPMQPTLLANRLHHFGLACKTM
jgi:hypothetical protein